MFEPTARYETGEDGQTVLPLFAPQPPESPAPSRRWTVRATVVELSVAASVFLVTAALFGALYIAAGGDRSAAAASLAERRGELADANGRLASAQAGRQQDQQRNSTLASQNVVLQLCVNAVQHGLWDNLSQAQELDAANAIIAECQ